MITLRNVNTKMNLNFARKPVPTRNGFGEGLLQAAKRNKNIYGLCADLTESTRMHLFANAFPKRFVDVGVAEQNLVTVGSGLAAIGKIPFVSSYATFCPGRCWEQIRTTICYNDQNVKIIGSHAGVSVGPDGATHQALEDVALMRALPNMVVIVPADYEQAKKATLAIAKHKGPCYLRLAREKTAQFTTNKTPFEIGKAQLLKQGKDIAIIGTGPLLEQCLKAAQLLQEQKIEVMVVNCHTIKPLDEKTILAAAKKCKKIVTVEEHQINGGLGSAVAELLAEKLPTPMVRVGVRDHFGESGTAEELYKEFKLDASYIVKQCHKLLR